MSQGRGAIADERENRTNWIQRFHRSHPVLSFIFLNLGVWLAAIGVVRLLPFVSVRWWSAGTLLAAIVTWVVLVFERPPRPGFGRR